MHPLELLIFKVLISLILTKFGNLNKIKGIKIVVEQFSRLLSKYTVYIRISRMKEAKKTDETEEIWKYCMQDVIYMGDIN